MDSNFFNSTDSAPIQHPDTSNTLQTDLATQASPNLHPNPNSLIQNEIHANSNHEGSQEHSSALSLPEQGTALFSNACSPLTESKPSEPDHAHHILARIGLSTSPHSQAHNNVSHQKPCAKITIKLHETHSRPQEQAQSGTNSDPFNLSFCTDLFSHGDVHVSVSHEKVTSTQVTPAVPKPLRKPLTEEKLETATTQSPVQIQESPQKPNTTTPGSSPLYRETPISTTHTATDFYTPMQTPNHVDDFIDPLSHDNLRSSMSTDKTLDSRRESSAIEALRDQKSEKPLTLGNENMFTIKTDMMGRQDSLSNERYRQSSLQIMSENKSGQRCGCNIF